MQNMQMALKILVLHGAIFHLVEAYVGFSIYLFHVCWRTISKYITCYC